MPTLLAVLLPTRFAGMNPKSKAPCKILMELDSIARRIGRFLSHHRVIASYLKHISSLQVQSYLVMNTKGPACGVDHVLYGRITLDVSFQDVRVSTASMDSIIGAAFRVMAALVEKILHPSSRSRAITFGHPEFVQMHCETKPWEWFQVSQTPPTVSLFGEHGGLWCYCQNVDSGPPESNHKPNPKAPSQHTQMQAESFEIQTAQRYVENIVIDFAADALHIDDSPASKAGIFAPSVLRDAQFVFEIAEGCEGDINVVSFEWKSKAISEPYHQPYTDWLTRHVFSKLTPGTCVRKCTEHKRHDKFLFRAHPSYRGHNQWHDWATFDWSGGNIEQCNDCICIPGQIVFFLEVTKEMAGIDVGGEMIFQSTGCFALIESLEDPLPHPGIVKGSKCLTTNQATKEKTSRWPFCRCANLYLVPVESIDEPISAIPNIGGNPGNFIFVRPVNTWSDCFSDYIAMCHGSLD
jgi:hypothetical protein